MDNIVKILRQLSPKEQEAMLLLMEHVKRDHRSVPGVVPLRGMPGWFRVRMGAYRVLFSVDPQTHAVEIRRIARRNEQTYKNL